MSVTSRRTPILCELEGRAAMAVRHISGSCVADTAMRLLVTKRFRAGNGNPVLIIRPQHQTDQEALDAAKEAIALRRPT